MAGRFRLIASAVLLVLPFLALLWVGSYNRALPALAGIPFFYWYQLAWIGIGAVLLWAASKLIGDR
ncbi:MAG: DUF3311 domain-containing protein [Alphaproteobacteria bacterium]|nr:DUF3311 domain-containing protein [Alphaproteobacteria bacterium]